MKLKPRMRSADPSGLDHLDPATSKSRDAASFRRVVRARKALDEAERELRQAVDAAREAGDSWTVIGAALNMSRQGAQQRYGH